MALDQPMIIFNDLITTDYYDRDTIEEAVEAMYKDAGRINKASLYYAWSIGKFVADRRLATKFGVATIRELAKLMKTSENTLFRYRTVYKMVNEKQLERLSDLRVSTNAILEVASVSKGHKEDAKLLMEALLDGSLDTVKSVSDHYSELVTRRLQEYNLLPGGEQETVINPVESVEEITEGIVEPESQDSLASRVLEEGENIIEAEVIESKDTKESLESQAKADAKALLRKVRASVAVIRRDMAAIDNNLLEQMEKITADYEVILCDKEITEQYDEMVHDLYLNMMTAFQKLAKQLIQGAKTGNITEPISLDKEALSLLDGKDLFTFA